MFTVEFDPLTVIMSCPCRTVIQIGGFFMHPTNLIRETSVKKIIHEEDRSQE